MRRQGRKFTSFAWTDRLKRASTRISMDGKGWGIDNIFIERLLRSLKYLHTWETGSQSKAAVSQWVKLYDHRRPHTAHGGRSPTVGYFNTIETDQQAQEVA